MKGNQPSRIGRRATGFAVLHKFATPQSKWPPDHSKRGETLDYGANNTPLIFGACLIFALG